MLIYRVVFLVDNVYWLRMKESSSWLAHHLYDDEEAAMEALSNQSGDAARYH